MATKEVPTITIIQADGLYPDDDLEKRLFAPSPTQNYELNYLQTDLYPTGAPERKPWSSIPDDVRKHVNGIEVLKMPFTERDLELFPALKV